VSEEEECVLILPDLDTPPMENLLDMIHKRVSTRALKYLVLSVSEEEECVLILPDLDIQPMENLLSMIHKRVSTGTEVPALICE